MTTAKESKRPAQDYRGYLLERLRGNPSEAAAYLNASFDEGEDVFLVALKDVVDAYGGPSDFAERAGLTRDAIYKICRKEGNPTLRNLNRALHTAGLRIRFDVKDGRLTA